MDGKAPQSVDALWADSDPRAEPLDVEILKQWEEDGVGDGIAMDTEASQRVIRHCMWIRSQPDIGAQLLAELKAWTVPLMPPVRTRSIRCLIQVI
jgi:hypothetical protein